MMCITLVLHEMEFHKYCTSTIIKYNMYIIYFLHVMIIKM